MKTVADNYPVFEANQILSNAHLNQVFDYLDEQERLTRANLIGIGVACGLEIRRDDAAGAVRMARGCGITSAGYLLVEQVEAALVAYREYRLAPDLAYPAFQDKGAPDKPQYPLWEMFADGEPDTTPLTMPAGFLDDKAVLLFLELKKEELRNCSPNDCNDRGSGVSVTVRRLLIRVADLSSVIANAAAVGSGLTQADIEAALTTRLNLPDLRMPRYDVPNTGPATTEQVWAAFRHIFRKAALARHAGAALSAAYRAFRPLLQRSYPSDPFDRFAADFGFLDGAPATPQQVTFLQYYVDFFDDLIRAYDEMRWAGARLLCACCAPEELFPRHLMLGTLRPADNPGLYRHSFIPSCAGESQTMQFEQLFQRLVAMVRSFTHQPPLPAASRDARTDRQIRITPSVAGAWPLADRAIPYYYTLGEKPPLLPAWSPARTLRNRASLNPGYRSDEYEPAAPAFVVDAIGHDLEAYDFLRIEGHLGKDCRHVLRTLLSLKTRHRLPIDIVALRTGAFDETMPLDAEGASASFRDLETLYDVTREQLLGALSEGVRYLYDVPLGVPLAAGTPRLPLLKNYAPGFRHMADTVGAWYEKYLDLFQARPYIDVDQNRIDANAVMTVYCFLFAGTADLKESFFAHVVSIYYLSKLSEILPDSLDALRYEDFENKHQDLVALTRYFRSDASKAVAPELQKFAPMEELIDHFDQVLYGCRLEPARALHDAYLQRMREAKKKQFLGFFLKKHPGIQHKAGVPLGGTFILVYHDASEPVGLKVSPERKATMLAGPNAAKLDFDALSGAFSRIGSNRDFARDPDIRMLLGALTGNVPDADLAAAPGAAEGSDRSIEDAVKGLRNGAVIADFFLPYLCCGEDASIQYVLPPMPLGLRVALSCTDPNGNAEASLTPDGGMPPISVQLDGQAFRPLTGNVLLTAGEHVLTIQDSAGARSAPQAVTVPGPLRIGQETYTDDAQAMRYRVAFTISGGVPPYVADAGTVNANAYTGDPVPSGQAVTVEISDSAGCKTRREFKHEVPVPCDLPCGGFALRSGYRLWLPDPDPERPFDGYAVEVPVFQFEFPQGTMVDIAQEAAGILRADLNDLSAHFNDVVKTWVKRLNRLIADLTGSKDWLRLDFEPDAKGMPTMWIEHFECLDFRFQVQASFSRLDLSDRLDVSYGPAGTAIVYDNDGQKAAIPAFNRSRIAKCDPARPVEESCGEVDLALRITKRLSESRLTLNVTASGNEQPVAFLWEVQDARPSVSGEKKAVFTLARRGQGIKRIRLTAYTGQGCMVAATDEVTLD
jgi:hypothetical protein